MKPLPNWPKVYKPESKPHPFCPGCGHPVVLKMLGEVIDEMGLAKETVFLIDIGCSLLAWDFYNLPTTQTHHGRTVPVAVGFKMALPRKIVLAYVGDGGGYAIGLQHTVTACLRDNPISVIVVNNTLYAMTGGQQAPTTLLGQWTTTTPAGKSGMVLHGPEMLKKVADVRAFLARGSTNQPLLLKKYLQKAIETQKKGHFALVEALSACPLNWQTNAAQTIKQMENLEKNFALGEIK